SRRARGSSSCSTGSPLSPTRSASRRTSRSPPRTQPSASAHDTRRARPSPRSTVSRCGQVSALADEERHEPTLDDLAAALQQIEVGQFLLSTVSTLASLAFGKLEQGELSQAKAAVDAIGALLPVVQGEVEDDLYRDFERALANLRVAYADAAAKSSGD